MIVLLVCAAAMAIVLYTYVGYPIAITLLAALFPRRGQKDEARGWRGRACPRCR